MGKNTKNGLSLFSSKVEWVNLLIPFFFIGICLLEILLSWTFDPNTRIWGRMLGNILLLNTPHTAMTYSMLVSMPEMKKWVNSKTGNQPLVFWRNLFFSWVIFSAFFAALFQVFTVPSLAYSAIFYIFVFFLDITVLQHHANSQSFGLSMVYSEKIRSFIHLNDQEKQRATRFAKLERRLAQSMVLITFCTMFCVRIHEHGHLTPENFEFYRNICFVIGIIVATSIVAVGFFTPYGHRTHKPIFLARFFIWPLISFSYLADLSQRAIHGIEYLFVYRKMMTSSSLPKENRFKALAFAWLALVGVVGIGLFSKQAGFLTLVFGTSPPFLFNFLMSMNFGHQFLHCFIDSKLWKMRDPVTREHIGALLMDKSISAKREF